MDANDNRWHRSNSNKPAKRLLCRCASEALSVFNIIKEQAHNFGAFYSSQHVKQSLKTVAKAVKVDAKTLQMQFEDVHPRVVNVASMSAGSADLNKSSWKAVIDKIKSHRAVAQSHPTGVLELALMLYFLFGLSSSGVEQNFSQAALGFSSRRQGASADTEESVLRVILDLPHHDKNQIIKLARKVWCQVYGDSRQGGSRLSKGVKRKASSLGDDDKADGTMAHSEKEFIKRRRDSAAAVSCNRAGPADLVLDADALMANAASGAGGAEWGEEHNKELVFQRGKLRARKLQAMAEGVLVGDAAMQAEANVVRASRLKDQRARMRKQGRQEQALAGRSTGDIREAIRGKSVYVDSGVTESPQLNAAIARMSMNKVLMHEAEVFITASPGQSGQRVKLATCLRGAFQASPKLLLSPSSGACVKWVAVANVPRTVYVSEACYDRHKHSIDFIKSVLDTMPSSKMVVKVEAWDALAALRLKYAKTPARVIALVRATEKVLPVWSLVVLVSMRH